jgi:hypothetical protein
MKPSLPAWKTASSSDQAPTLLANIKHNLKNIESLGATYGTANDTFDFRTHMRQGRTATTALFQQARRASSRGDIRDELLQLVERFQALERKHLDVEQQGLQEMELEYEQSYGTKPGPNKSGGRARGDTQLQRLELDDAGTDAVIIQERNTEVAHIAAEMESIVEIMQVENLWHCFRNRK